MNEPWEESQGLIALIHQPGEIHPQFDNYFYLPLKSSSEIQLSKNYEKRLPKPKGTCDLEDNAPPIQECLESCRISKISQACNCRVSFDVQNLNGFETDKECSWFEIRECVDKISAAVSEAGYSSCECSIPCEESVVEAGLKVRDRTGIAGMQFDSDSLVSESLDAAQLELLLYYGVKTKIKKCDLR